MNNPTLEGAEPMIFSLLSGSSKPLSKTKLIKGKGQAAREKALPLLVKDKRIVNLGSNRKTAYIAVPEGESLDLTEKTEKSILDHQPSKPTPLSLTKLKKLVEYKALQDQVVIAAGNLVKKKLGIMFRCGSGTYFLHLAPIRDLLESPVNGHGKSNVSDLRVAEPNVGEKIISSYRELERKTGTPDVSIASLIQACGLSPSIVHTWLSAECSAQRANPSEGEPTLASPEERAAALKMDGETFYLIRLQ